MAIGFNGIITPNKSKGPIINDGPLMNDGPTVPHQTSFPTTNPPVVGNGPDVPLIPTCITPSPGPGWVCVPHPDGHWGPDGVVKGHWVFQGNNPPPPPVDCFLSDIGLALGETPISLNGTIQDHFNGTWIPANEIVQTDGLHRTEAARRLSLASVTTDYIFVNIGEQVSDKCFLLNTSRNKLPIPTTNTIVLVSFYFPQFGEYLYVGDDMFLYRLEEKRDDLPSPPPGVPLGSGKIYTKIPTSDKLENLRTTTTYGMWSDNVGNLLTFFTSSAQNTGSRLYNLEVRQKVDTDCDSEVQFSIAYGHADGSGSYDLGGYDYLTPSKAVYGQYKSLCLEATESYFNINNQNAKSIYVINARRARMGDRMDEGNWELNLHHLSGSQFTAGGGNRNAYTGSNIQLGTAGAVLRLIDDSNINSASITSAGEVYRVISGSIEQGAYTPSTPVVYGLSYPKLGVLILDSTKLDSDASFLTVTGSEVSASNPHQLLTAISGAALYTDVSGDSLGFQARKTKYSYISHYYVRVKNYDYNHTNNPSWVTGSEGQIHPNFRPSDGEPVTYITQVGLYNQRRELLAVGKLSKAIKKTCVDEALIKVDLKYE